MQPDGISPTKGTWPWSRDCFYNFAVCRDAARRAGLSATAELLVSYNFYMNDINIKRTESYSDTLRADFVMIDTIVESRLLKSVKNMPVVVEVVVVVVASLAPVPPLTASLPRGPVAPVAPGIPVAPVVRITPTDNGYHL